MFRARQKSLKKFWTVVLPIAFCSMVIAACGGGGSGSGGGGGSSSSGTSSSAYTISASIDNLTVPGLRLTDGMETIDVPVNAASVQFPAGIASGAKFDVTVASQPFGFVIACTVNNASGTVNNANVTNVAVACHPAKALVTTLAGYGFSGGNNATGTAAGFDSPYGLAVDKAGNIYVADTSNHLIRKIDPEGVVSTLAGNGVNGNANGTGTSASFSYPQALALDGQGNIYVADSGNNLIRKISSGGIVSTFAGSGARGYSDGAATAATFKNPRGIAVDSSGNVFVGDTGNGLVRKITATGNVTTIAGTLGRGINSMTNLEAYGAPYGLAVDGNDNVYVAADDNCILEIDPTGAVTNVAGDPARQGNTDGVGIQALFYTPIGIAVDAGGNLYVADFNNNLVRKIDPARSVTTLAGGGSNGTANVIGTAASLSHPAGLAIDSYGNIYVANSGYSLILKISPQ